MVRIRILTRLELKAKTAGSQLLWLITGTRWIPRSLRCSGEQARPRDYSRIRCRGHSRCGTLARRSKIATFSVDLQIYLTAISPLQMPPLSEPSEGWWLPTPSGEHCSGTLNWEHLPYAGGRGILPGGYTIFLPLPASRGGTRRSGAKYPSARQVRTASAARRESIAGDHGRFSRKWR